MIEYNDIKNLLIWKDPILGNVSLDFILTGLQDCIKKQYYFESIIYDILKDLKYDNEALCSLFNLSETNTIDMYLKMIKDEL